MKFLWVLMVEALIWHKTAVKAAFFGEIMDEVWYFDRFGGNFWGYDFFWGYVTGFWGYVPEFWS